MAHPTLGINQLTVTLTGTAQRLSNEPILAYGFEIYNNGASTAYVGGSNLTTTISRPISVGNFWSPDPAVIAGSYEPFDLSKVYVIGTATQTLLVIYTSMIN